MVSRVLRVLGCRGKFDLEAIGDNFFVLDGCESVHLL